MIKTLSYAVTGQQIETTETAMLVAGTVNVYTARFAFDEAWDGLQRTAVFASSDNSTSVTREQLLTDDACTVPWEVLVAGNRLRVGVYGTKADGTRLPTIWTERRLYIYPGAGPTQEAADPSPTLVEQLLGRIGDPANLKTEDKSSLVAAINEVWSSGGSGGSSVTDAAINEDGHLIITLSTGKEIDAGYAVGPAGATGATGTAGKDGQDGAPGKNGADGQPGADGVGIQSVVQTTTSTEDGGTNVVTVTKTDGTTSTFEVRNGGKGSTGPAGADGKDGADGQNGADGAVGPAGADGKSAYQYAQDGGYTGTEAEFASKMAREYNPDSKTDAMTQAVGLDAAGKLWTEPGSGGGSSSEVWDTIIDTELTQDTGAVRFTSDTSGNPFSLKEFKIFVVQPPIDGQTVNNRVAFAPNGNGWGGIGNVPLKSSPKETENTVYSFIHVNTVDRHMNLLTALVSSNYSSVRDILQENTSRNNYDSTFTKKVNTTKNELNYLEMPVTSIGFVGITSVIFGAGTKILVRGIRS